MKKTVFRLSVILVLLTQITYAQGAKKTSPPAKSKTPVPAASPVSVIAQTVNGGMKNAIDSVSYAIGMNIASNLKNQKLNVNSEMIAKAIDQSLKNQATWLEPEAANVYLQSYFQNEAMKVGAANQAAGEKFLAENKAKAGIITLPSGLQYQIITEGKGEKPTSADKVSVHYEGKLINGTVFDSSIQRGQPAEFGVTQVIQGWVEALQLMPVGSKWKLFIPSNLAYGPQAPPSIGPNQVLIFDVELLNIVK